MTAPMTTELSLMATKFRYIRIHAGKTVCCLAMLLPPRCLAPACKKIQARLSSLSSLNLLNQRKSGDQ